MGGDRNILNTKKRERTRANGRRLQEVTEGNQYIKHVKTAALELAVLVVLVALFTS